MPQIAPITLPKIRSFKKVLSKEKVPSKIENTKKAEIVNKNPIKSPFKSPISLCFFMPTNTPKKILTPLITWFTGAIILSEMLVKRKTNAKSKMPTSAVASPTKTPFKMHFHIWFLSCFSLLNVFAFIIASSAIF